jgi:hypothetical protein
MGNSLPLARKESLIVQELSDETLVYDRERDEAHCLNRSAALVWKHCDGRKTIREIGQALERELNTTIDDRVIWLALDQLGKSDLLQAHRQEYLGNVSRRQLVRTLGLVAVSIPLITSIVAPVPAQAASGLPPGSCCNNPSDCLSGNCNPAGAGTCPAQPSDKVCA